MRTIEFVSYTGSYPNLCSGILTVRIDGIPYKFGYDFDGNEKTDYGRFWESGGTAGVDDDGDWHVTEGEWEFDRYFKGPDHIMALLPELLRIFNENVPKGCCGGCI